MSYDERTARRVRSALGGRPGFEEIRMFGGLCFTLGGHMVCGVHEDLLILRLGKEGALEALRHTHVRPMDFTGKPLSTMVFVDPPGHRTDAALRSWIERAVQHVQALAPRAGAAQARRTPRTNQRRARR